MIDIQKWMEIFIRNLNTVFEERIEFIGLQGSYARGEATENSDIDVVVILDKLMPEDVYRYNEILDKLEHRSLICGFLSGKEELLKWEPSDLFQLYYDTIPMKGNPDKLLEIIDKAAVSRAIKTGACNIYHICVHNMLHKKSNETLKGLFKSASFVVQAIYFKETGKYIKSLSELVSNVNREEKEIIQVYLDIRQGKNINFTIMSEMIFLWAKTLIVEEVNKDG